MPSSEVMWQQQITKGTLEQLSLCQMGSQDTGSIRSWKLALALLALSLLAVKRIKWSSKKRRILSNRNRQVLLTMRQPGRPSGRKTVVLTVRKGASKQWLSKQHTLHLQHRLCSGTDAQRSQDCLYLQGKPHSYFLKHAICTLWWQDAFHLGLHSNRSVNNSIKPLVPSLLSLL